MTEHCVQVSTGVNSRIRYSNNVLTRCGDEGFSVINVIGEKSGDKYVNNVVSGLLDPFGEAFLVVGGNPSIVKNLTDDVHAPVVLTETRGAVVKDNLFFATRDDVIELLVSTTGTVFTGNTAEGVGGSDAVLWLSYDADPGAPPFKKFAKNNISNFGDLTAFEFDGVFTAHVFTTQGNFWGDLDSVDGKPKLDGDIDVVNAINGGDLVMFPSLKANPVKYRGGLWRQTRFRAAGPPGSPPSVGPPPPS